MQFKLLKNLSRRFKIASVYYHYPEFKRLPIEPRSDKEHLKAVIGWLSRAQDANNDGGVSSHYDFLNRKWGRSYRETTGYIIETFLNYFLLTGDKEYLSRAVRMGDWEISVQCEDGSFGEVKPDGTIGKKIFNTGQIIIGLIALFNQTKDNKYLSAAEKAAGWLVANQEPDGSWDKFTTQGPRTYHSRVAWPLLQLHKITGNDGYLKAAKRNISWVISQQKENFWFDNTSLSAKNEPWTHLIAYTISGLLECYCLTGKSDKKLFESFHGCASALLDYYEKHGDLYLPCSFDGNWRSGDDYSCLTGDAQLAIVWMQVYALTGEKRFLAGAERMITQIKATQILDAGKKEINGGVLGSYPLYGDYGSFSFLNWAAKFFADALILKIKI